MAQPSRLRSTAYQSDGSGSDTYTLDAGSDRIVLFQISYVAASVESLSPTYGGNALTEVTGSPVGPSAADDVVTHLFYILEADLPADGDNTFSYSVSADTPGISIATYEGAKQAAPDDVTAKTDRNSSHEITYDVTTAEDDSLIYAVVGASDQNTTLTHGTGQTELNEAAFNIQANPHAHTEEFKSSATTDTQSHAGDATTANSSYSAIGVAIAPDSGGGGSSLPILTPPAIGG